MPKVPCGGRIEVSPTAIASIASEAVLTCYGVVGMTTKNLANGIARAMTRNRNRGVLVRIEDTQITIDVYVIIEYGTRIVEVAHSVMDVVRFEVERALGRPVAEVNVHVQGLRVSNID